MTDIIQVSSPHEWISGDSSKRYTNLDDKTQTLHVNVGPHNVISYFERKITVIRQKRFKVSNLRRYFKVIRKVLHLNKNPKRKGYEKFLTDEEKQWLEDYKANVVNEASFLNTCRAMAYHS